MQAILAIFGLVVWVIVSPLIMLMAMVAFVCALIISDNTDYHEDYESEDIDPGESIICTMCSIIDWWMDLLKPLKTIYTYIFSK